MKTSASSGLSQGPQRSTFFASRMLDLPIRSAVMPSCASRVRSTPCDAPKQEKRLPHERSRSTTATLMPQEAARTAQVATSVVLPTPPRPETKVIRGDVSSCVARSSSQAALPSAFWTSSTEAAPAAEVSATGTPASAVTRTDPCACFPAGLDAAARAFGFRLGCRPLPCLRVRSSTCSLFSLVTSADCPKPWEGP